MQNQASALFPTLSPKSRVCVADGYGISISVRRGRLVVKDGIGPERRERIFTRATAGIDRLVLLGHTGFITLEATRWLADVGIGLIHIGADGRLLATSSSLGVDKPALRRAQAIAATNVSGLAVTAWILTEKLRGQRSVLRELEATAAEEEVAGAEAALSGATSQKSLRFVESQAALAYWKAWGEVPVRFAKADLQRVPEDWDTFGKRSSPLTQGPRLAVNPANALLNYCYAIAEAEARIACLAVGLDPGVGILHADVDSRDSLALDVMEAVRPEVDAFILNILRTRAFAARDFHEDRRGVCRVLPPLTHHLVAAARMWRRRTAAVAEQVARMLARGANEAPRTATPITQDTRSAHRDAMRSRPKRRAGEAVRLPSACVSCGLILRGRRRQFCDDCLPERYEEQRQSLVLAGPAALRRLRAQGRDPNHRPEVRAKIGRSQSQRRMLDLAWDASHPGRPDRAVFDAIVPGLRPMPLRRIAEATGLSIRAASYVRAGTPPHPRHWEALRKLVGAGQD